MANSQTYPLTPSSAQQQSIQENVELTALGAGISALNTSESHLSSIDNELNNGMTWLQQQFADDNYTYSGSSSVPTRQLMDSMFISFISKTYNIPQSVARFCCIHNINYKSPTLATDYPEAFI